MVIYPQLYDFNGVRDREERELVKKLAAEMIQRAAERRKNLESNDHTHDADVYLHWMFKPEMLEYKWIPREDEPEIRGEWIDEEVEPQEYREVNYFRLWELWKIRKRGHGPVTDSYIEDYL